MPPRTPLSRWFALAALALIPAAVGSVQQPASPPATQAPETPALYKAHAPALGVHIIDENWHDASRDRDIPVRIYLPVAGHPEDAKAPPDATPQTRFPLIVLSHGLGG